MLTLVGIALFVGFIALGVWQVQRRAWKLDLIERVTQRIQAPPGALPPPAQWPQVDATGYAYQPVRLQGQWLADKTVLAQASTALGAGYWVMTPLQQADGTQVLVNRGFVPQGQRAQWKARPATPPGTATEPVTVEGLLRMSEPGGGFLRRNDPAQQRWYSRDVAAMAQARQLPRAAPFFVDAGIPDRQSAATAERPPAAQGPWPRQGLTVVRFANSHLVYAITWFGLALMVAGAAVLVARYEAKLRAAHRQHPAHEPQP
ncbi:MULTISPECIES: SURF1 family protein [unclassified Acidovorax]|jgi:surfeit locus 1 family protein|uniref:SURF1 family protein n=1 Tax=unclassified Acidovorax TaxID=2684926 RepID=UPI000B3F6B80|nr:MULTISPECIES: SURF1 family protein [unclassified Acidovorax]MBP3979714.1 SURF1 family protein [Acidovorax sp. JG5]